MITINGFNYSKSTGAGTLVEEVNHNYNISLCILI